LAESYGAESLAGERLALGRENQLTLMTAADLALAYLSQGKFAQSESLARDTVRVYREKYPDDWHRSFVESLLGASLKGQKKYAEAEPLLLLGYREMSARKGGMAVPDRYRVDLAGEWLRQLYQAWGKLEKAAEWKPK